MAVTTWADPTDREQTANREIEQVRERARQGRMRECL
jgi:hypothetical protein